MEKARLDLARFEAQRAYEQQVALEGIRMRAEMDAGFGQQRALWQTIERGSDGSVDVVNISWRPEEGEVVLGDEVLEVANKEFEEWAAAGYRECVDGLGLNRQEKSKPRKEVREEDLNEELRASWEQQKKIARRNKGKKSTEEKKRLTELMNRPGKYDREEWLETVNKVVDLIGQLEMIEGVRVSLRFEGIGDLLNLVGGEDWDEVMSGLDTELDTVLERQERIKLEGEEDEVYEDMGEGMDEWSEESRFDEGTEIVEGAVGGMVVEGVQDLRQDRENERWNEGAEGLSVEELDRGNRETVELARDAYEGDERQRRGSEARMENIRNENREWRRQRAREQEESDRQAQIRWEEILKVVKEKEQKGKERDRSEESE